MVKRKIMEQDSTSKNFSYVAIGRIISISLQGIFYLLFAALLDPETYGELNVIIGLRARTGMGDQGGR